MEERASGKDRFGQNNEVIMPFKELLNKLATGDELHYMTTQDLGTPNIAVEGVQ